MMLPFLLYCFAISRHVITLEILRCSKRLSCPYLLIPLSHRFVVRGRLSRRYLRIGIDLCTLEPYRRTRMYVSVSVLVCIRYLAQEVSLFNLGKININQSLFSGL